MHRAPTGRSRHVDRALMTRRARTGCRSCSVCRAFNVYTYRVRRASSVCGRSTLALYVARSGHLGTKTTPARGPRPPRAGPGRAGHEQGATHHVAAHAVRPVLAGPAARLNAAPALGGAPLPGTPACPEHVRGAQQVLVAVSVRGKPRGKKGVSAA